VIHQAVGQFNKIPSIVQIWFAEFLAVMFLFPVASKIYERLQPAVEYHSLPLDKADYVFFVIGLLIYAWLLVTILRPRVHTTRFVPVFRAGGVAVWNEQMAADYLFSSTHPSYIFVDILACGFWWFVRWLWSEGWQERAFQGTILILLAAFIPVIRLLAWYVLRLRPPRDERTEVRTSWKPVVWLYAVLIGLGVITAAFVIPAERRDQRLQAEKEAQLMVVDGASWKGSLSFGELRDPGKTGQTVSRVVRLRATQTSLEATICGNKAGQTDFATVLASLGREEVLIFSYSRWSKLVKRAAGNGGKPIEAIGRLGPMPDQPPSWKNICGLEDLPRRPRWLFEEENP
jgi:hypothetical protein